MLSHLKCKKKLFDLFSSVKKINIVNNHSPITRTNFGGCQQSFYSSRVNFYEERNKMSSLSLPNITLDKNLVQIEKIKTEYWELIRQIKIFLSHEALQNKNITQLVDLLKPSKIDFVAELLVAKTLDEVIKVIYNINFVNIERYKIAYNDIEQTKELNKLKLDVQQHQIVHEGMALFRQILTQHTKVATAMRALVQQLNELKGNNFSSGDADIDKLLKEKKNVEFTDVISIMNKYFDKIKQSQTNSELPIKSL